MRYSLYIMMAVVVFVFANGHALALSCMPPEGDQVEKTILNAKTPIWFGNATLLEYDTFENKGTFQINETYLTTHSDKIPSKTKVIIAKFYQTWGPFFDINKAESKRSLNKPNNYSFKYLEDKNVWSFAGPGGCTFYNDDNWNKLKDGYYEKYVKQDSMKEDKEETNAY